MRIASTKASSANRDTMLSWRSIAIVLPVAPLDAVEEQKLPKPWVGWMLTGGGRCESRALTSRYCARVRASGLLR